MTESSYADLLGSALLQIKAIRLNPREPFTWASGLKSPVYCDNRLILSFPPFRSMAIEGLRHLALQFPETQAIAGVATAGIPHGVLLADRMNLPFVYVRSQAKSHGRGNKIEGQFNPGTKVLVIEDLISTGGSSIDAAAALSEAGGIPLAVLGLFSYKLPAAEARFNDAGIPCHTVTDFPRLIAFARAEGYVNSDDMALLESWYHDPAAWSGRFTASFV